MRAHLLVAGLLPLFVAASAATAAAQTATVTVDCDHHQSVNRALRRHPQAAALIVEIEGLCTENVVVTRDRVTLRGGDPATDGIQATANAEPIDAAVWVRGAHLVTIENLRLTGGYAGLLASEASTPHTRVVNSRLEGNAAYGVLLEAALVQVVDSVLDSNGNVNAGAFNGSRFECNGCTLSNPLGSGGLGTFQNNVLALTGSAVILAESTLTEGGVSVNNASALVFDSTIEARPPGPGIPPALFMVDSQGGLTRTEVAGAMRLGQGSNLQLAGVVQTRADGGNTAEDNAYVRIGDAPPAAGGPPSVPSIVLGLTLRNFSTGSLLQTSQIDGNLTCVLGADAVCVNPANVNGPSSCGQCPVP